METRRDNILRRLDWWTIGMFIALGIMGWLAICGASHSYIDSSFLEFFNQGERSGKQALWMCISVITGIGLLCIPKNTYRNIAPFLYAATLLLGFVTIFIAADIKGSRSWIAVGPFRIQPAEFMKFATSLMLAYYMGRREFNMSNNRDLMKCIGIILLPMLIIIAQKETGSALVYLALFLVLYREGMTGIFLLTAVSAIIYFVVGVKYGAETMSELPVNIGEYAPTVIIQIISISIVKFWCKHDKTAKLLFIVNIIATPFSYWIAVYLIEFNIMFVQYTLLLFNILYLLLQIRLSKEKRNVWVALYIVGAIGFNYSCSYIMQNVMQPHQKERIEVLFGLKEDKNDAGYNVMQSKIAIGSGELLGKGFLNGTQTKYNFVPEQETDFIFCMLS